MKNKNETNETVNAVETVSRSPGRPRDNAKLRPIRLDSQNRPMGKGAPKLGEVRVVWVQRAIKNSEFNFETTPIARSETIMVGPRNKSNKPRKPRKLRASKVTTVTINRSTFNENGVEETQTIVTPTTETEQVIA